jgi:hypothetical protein
VVESGRVILFDDGRIALVEVFDSDDREAILARFAELAQRQPRRRSAARHTAPSASGSGPRAAAFTVRRFAARAKHE